MKPTVSQSSESQLPPYLIWGLVPAAGIVGGGAFLLGRRSNRVTTSIVDVMEPEEQVSDTLALEAATDRHHYITDRENAAIGMTKSDDR